MTMKLSNPRSDNFSSKLNENKQLHRMKFKYQAFLVTLFNRTSPRVFVKYHVHRRGYNN